MIQSSGKAFLVIEESSWNPRGLKWDRTTKMDGYIREGNTEIWTFLPGSIVVPWLVLLSLDDFFGVTVSKCFFP